MRNEIYHSFLQSLCYVGPAAVFVTANMILHFCLRRHPRHIVFFAPSPYVAWFGPLVFPLLLIAALTQLITPITDRDDHFFPLLFNFFIILRSITSALYIIFLVSDFVIVQTVFIALHLIVNIILLGIARYLTLNIIFRVVTGFSNGLLVFTNGHSWAILLTTIQGGAPLSANTNIVISVLCCAFALVLVACTMNPYVLGSLILFYSSLVSKSAKQPGFKTVMAVLITCLSVMTVVFAFICSRNYILYRRSQILVF